MQIPRRTLVGSALALVLTAAALAQGGAAQSTPPQASPAPAAPAKSKTLTALQGTWVLTSADGEDLTGGPEVALSIIDDTYAQTLDGDVVERGRLKVDDSKKPTTIDLAIEEGSDAGTTQLGVIEIAADTLRGKLNSPGDNVRPNDFEPADGFFAFTAVRKRAAR
jgi:uncharacterized protein (TIGR03067 family)